MDELDQQVIQGMKEFKFGSEDKVEHRLITVLLVESKPYIRTVTTWDKVWSRRQSLG